MKSKKEKVVIEPLYTDILQEYFSEEGVEKVKLTYMNGEKVVKVEVQNS